MLLLGHVEIAQPLLQFRNQNLLTLQQEVLMCFLRVRQARIVNLLSTLPGRHILQKLLLLLPEIH